MVEGCGKTVLTIDFPVKTRFTYNWCFRALCYTLLNYSPSYTLGLRLTMSLNLH